MADFRIRSHLIGTRMNQPNLFTRALLSLGAVSLISMLTAPSARTDATTYLINVTVRPGYHFSNSADALSYGQHICTKTAAGQPYQNLIADIKTDVNTSDDFQASYLIAQAVNELCPALIWQLRNSAAHYRPALPGAS